MNKRIIMKWPVLGKQVRIELMQNFNPEICDIFISQLPVESIQSHAVVCGKQMYFPFALVRYPDKIAYEDMSLQPIGRINLELNFQYLSLNYGPNHEAVPSVAIGQVIEEDISIVEEIGLLIWNNLLFSNDHIKVIVEAEIG